MKLAFALVLLAAGTLGAPAASAHAMLDRAEPRVGATVSAAPKEVRLWFSDTLEAAFSRVEVTDETGKRVDNADARVDPSDRSIMRITLRPLAPGTYRVIWHALSPDTHRTEGDFTFTVRP